MIPTPSSIPDNLLHEADALYVRGNLRAARERYAQLLARMPSRADVHYRIACCAWAEGQTDVARSHFEEAARLMPNYGDAHEGLGQLLMETGDLERADFHSQKALELSPQDVDIAVSRAFVLQAQRQTDAAWELVKSLIDRGQITGRLGVVFSRMAPKLKKEAEALDVLGRVLSSANVNPREERGLRFAAAGLLDRLGRYDEAFDQVRLANRLRSMNSLYTPASAETGVTRLIGWFTKEKLASLPRADRRNDRPIFIVGMPRSGTSLVEQILASHPRVYAGGELPYLPRVVESAARVIGAAGLNYPQCLDQLTSAKADELAAMYWDPISATAAGAARATDKLPLNFLHLGLISLLFPQSRIIHCRRVPVDVCLSCHMTDFASGNEFSFDLAHAGHFYRQYERLMEHWRQVIDLAMLEVEYEQVVEDLEPQARRLVEFAGLDWDPRCLNFHETQRYVWTASSEQVRRPIYKSSVHRWRKYEKHLGPLIEALRPVEKQN